MQLLKRALELRLDAQGEAHPEVWDQIHQVAVTLTQDGDHEAAAELFLREHCLREAAAGAHHPSLMALLHSLGTALLKSQQVRQARDVLLSALQRFSGSPIVRRPDVASMQWLASVAHSAMGEHSEVRQSEHMLLNIPSDRAPFADPAGAAALLLDLWLFGLRLIDKK